LEFRLLTLPPGRVALTEVLLRACRSSNRIIPFPTLLTGSLPFPAPPAAVLRTQPAPDHSQSSYRPRYALISAGVTKRRVIDASSTPFGVLQGVPPPWIEMMGFCQNRKIGFHSRGERHGPRRFARRFNLR